MRITNELESIDTKKYKKTELGFLPVEWNLMRLYEIGDIVTGSTPNTKIVDYYGGDYLFVTPGDISDKKYVSDTEKKLTKKGFDVSRKIPKNSIMVTCIGYIGKIAMTDREVTTNQQINSIIPNKGIISDYIYYSLDYYFNRSKNRVIEHQVVPIINKTKFSHFLLPIPSIFEQQKIADILSTWDKAIELKEKLIEQKKEQKKGLMQRLLTGKVRLPGFEGEWKSKKLGEITECLDNLRKPLNSSEREKMKGDIPYYGANGVVDYVNDFIFNEKLILLAEDGGYFDEFSERPIAFRIEGKSWVNNHAHVLRVREGVDFDFLFYSLVHKDIRPFINGTTRTKLTKNDMLSIEVQIPNYEVQKKIATILNSIDKEIGLLERETELIKQQKKGLMQLLLTGKVRVKC